MTKFVTQILDDSERLLSRLVRWFGEYDSCIVSFSAGVDSSLLSLCAKKALGSRAFAVTSLSPSFSKSERDATERIAKEIGIDLLVVNQDDLGTEGYVNNGINRCYFCRSNLANAIIPIAKKLSVSVCVDGTHLDDMHTPRPGIKALREAGFRAPFVELGLGKESVRAIARLAGLSNWDRPSEACISSRVAFGQRIDMDTLRIVEDAESYVKEKTRARIVRVRTIGKRASVEVDKESVAIAFARLDDIVEKLRILGYEAVSIDPNGYSSGKMLELFVKDSV